MRRQKIAGLLQFIDNEMCVKNEKGTSAGVKRHENAESSGRKVMRFRRGVPGIEVGRRQQSMTGTAFLQDPLVYAIEHYTDMVLRLAAHYAPNLSDVEDVVQDVFEKLVRFEKGFENEEHLRAWLIRVTINHCHTLARASRNSDVELQEWLPAREEGGQWEMLTLVRQLPPNDRDAIYLHYYEGYTAKEIAQILHTRPNTVLTWLRRGREALRGHMEGDGGYEC